MREEFTAYSSFYFLNIKEGYPDKNSWFKAQALVKSEER